MGRRGSGVAGAGDDESINCVDYPSLTADDGSDASTMMSTRSSLIACHQEKDVLLLVMVAAVVAAACLVALILPVLPLRRLW